MATWLRDSFITAAFHQKYGNYTLSKFRPITIYRITPDDNNGNFKTGNRISFVSLHAY